VLAAVRLYLSWVAAAVAEAADAISTLAHSASECLDPWTAEDYATAASYIERANKTPHHYDHIHPLDPALLDYAKQHDPTWEPPQ
jgi:hypothetical protein